MRATELFALTQQAQCQGPDECHWCGAACERLWRHDEPPPVPYVRRHRLAVRPGNGFICTGCWLWRRGSVTIHFLGGGYKDRQQAKNHSWWLCKDGAWALQEQDYPALYRYLLKPPAGPWALLLKGEHEVCLQLAAVNLVEGAKAETIFQFSLNNVLHDYSVYELEQAQKLPSDGFMAGTRVLAELFHLGPPEVSADPLAPPPEPIRARGRPNKRDNPNRILRSA